MTVDGEKRLKFIAVSDNEMGDHNGRTHYDGEAIVIEVKRTIRHNAYLGDGYARNTISHEFGHAAMHYEKLKSGVVLARNKIEAPPPAWINFYESAEHQVKVFAPAFLANDNVAATLTSATEISVRFGMSQQSADIYFAELIAERERPKIAAEMRSFAEEMRNRQSEKKHEVKFLNDPCACCGRPTLFPVAHKFMCQTCDTVYDRFQDGDLAN